MGNVTSVVPQQHRTELKVIRGWTMAELLENNVHIQKQVRFDRIPLPQARVEFKELEYIQGTFDLVLLWVARVGRIFS